MEVQGLWILLVIVAVIGFAVYNWYASAQRRKAMMAWAVGNRMMFSPDRRGNLDDRFPNFECLQQGDNRYAYNILEGNWKGRKFLGFDYHYETHSHSTKGGRRTTHHHFSAVIISSDLILKPLFVRPETFLDKITEFVGYDDIDFESAEFSRKFYVKSTDKKWAYDVLHPRTMEFLLTCPGFTLKFDWNCIIAFRNSTFDPNDFQSAAEVVCGILDRFPDYLVRQLREEFPTQKRNA